MSDFPSYGTRHALLDAFFFAALPGARFLLLVIVLIILCG